MPDDAMVWHPTTPPVPHNPYPQPQYMPGGWPAPSPAFRYTTGVFARKRKATDVERTVKRVCLGIWSLGIYTIAIPVKPIYLIVRSYRRRKREEERRAQRSPNRSRRNSIAAHAQAAAVAVASAPSKIIQTEPLPAQPDNPPITQAKHHLAVDVPKTPSLARISGQSPSASSVTNTETPLHTTSSTSNIIVRRAGGITKSNNKKRGRDTSYRSKRLTINENYLAAIERAEQRITEAELLPPSKKMKGPNRFDAGYKHSPTAYGGRGANTDLQVKSIGAKLENPQGIGKLFGGWEFEKPIELTPPHSPTPSEQMQSELESHISEHHSASKFEERIPENEERRAPVLLTEEYDQSWDSIGPAEKYHPEIYFEMGEEEIKEERRAALVPPPIRPRIIPSSQLAESAQDKPREHDIQAAKISDGSKLDEDTKEGDISMAVGTQEPIASESSKDSNKAITIEASEIKDEATESTFEKIPVSAPHTPMQVVAKKPAKEELETPAPSTTQDGFETPAEKLSKLKIDGEADNDTPKATPHSGTKTKRVTRYREALEKAQKAKLEQYELVAVSGEWRDRVRQAVRHGIPEYLGPQDLARVAPQYGTRGQDNWLNDETINKYLEIVAAHGRKNDRLEQVRSHHTFNNFFYNNLKSKGPESVTRWSKRAKIGGKNLAYVEKIFVPINSGAHWTLAVVEPTQKRITHYNSMRGSATGIRACEDLKQWIALEQGKDFKEEEWTFAIMGESPQQTNSDDCGVFTITSARQIMLGYTPMSYGAAQIPDQRVRIVAELVNKGLLKSGGGM